MSLQEMEVETPATGAEISDEAAAKLAETLKPATVKSTKSRRKPKGGETIVHAEGPVEGEVLPAKPPALTPEQEAHKWDAADRAYGNTAIAYIEWAKEVAKLYDAEQATQEEIGARYDIKGAAVSQLISVSKDPRFEKFAGRLPGSTYTLYLLTRLDDAELEEFCKPTTTQAEVKSFLAKKKAEEDTAKVAAERAAAGLPPVEVAQPTTPVEEPTAPVEGADYKRTIIGEPAGAEEGYPGKPEEALPAEEVQLAQLTHKEWLIQYITACEDDATIEKLYELATSFTN